MTIKVLAAPDSFKGSLSALQAAQAMERGIKRRWPDCEVLLAPIADGGEGTALALAEATGGHLEYRQALDPLGQEIEAYFGVLGDGKSGVVEVAQASGLPLVPVERRNPLLATSYGTGQLIKAALDYGCTSLVLGIGGSATNDGGMGMLSALGVKFLDHEGNQLPGQGRSLIQIDKIDFSGLDQRLKNMPIKVACDVNNPLCGPQGASAVYGPQKGATPEVVKELDRGLAHYAKKIKEFLGEDVADFPGAGAAGGIGAGLLAFLKAELVPGVELIIQAAGMGKMVQAVDFVLTGEGETDSQTASGKAPVGVAVLAKKYGKPVFCVSGSRGKGYELVYGEGIDAVFSICPGPLSLDEAMAGAGELLERAVFEITGVWQAAKEE